MTRRHARIHTLRRLPTPPQDPPHGLTAADLLLVGLCVLVALMALSLLLAAQPILVAGAPVRL